MESLEFMMDKFSLNSLVAPRHELTSSIEDFERASYLTENRRISEIIMPWINQNKKTKNKKKSQKPIIQDYPHPPMYIIRRY